MKGKTSFCCCQLITFRNLFLASSGIVNVYKRVQKMNTFLEIFVVFIDFWILILASSGIVNTYKRIQKWSLCHVFEYFWIRILAGSGIVNMYKWIQKWSLCHVLCVLLDPNFDRFRNSKHVQTTKKLLICKK